VPVFTSTIVDALLLKGGIIGSWILALAAAGTAPGVKPDTDLHGRRSFTDYLEKHSCLFLVAPVVMAFLEALIDAFYLFS
jgi:hypothetical protein